MGALNKIQFCLLPIILTLGNFVGSLFALDFENIPNSILSEGLRNVLFAPPSKSVIRTVEKKANSDTFPG